MHKAARSRAQSEPGAEPAVSQPLTKACSCLEWLRGAASCSLQQVFGNVPYVSISHLSREISGFSSEAVMAGVGPVAWPAPLPIPLLRGLHLRKGLPSVLLNFPE